MGNGFHLHDPARPSYSANFPANAILGQAWVSLRRIKNVAGSPNHWAVLISVPNHGFINIQFHQNSTIELTYHPTMRDAALASWGCQVCDIRTSNYGSTSRYLNVGDLVNQVQNFLAGQFANYVFGFNDCQNFARALIRWFNDKWVGPFPLENGTDFSYH